MGFEVEKIGSCVVITMNLGENRLNTNFIRAMNKALDEAEKLVKKSAIFYELCDVAFCRYDDAKCLVTTAVGKYYSLGLDLEWMANQQASELLQFADGSQQLLARLLTFPLVTVAAINGVVKKCQKSRGLISSIESSHYS